ncbi:hypothetical protein KR074_010314 [Drosophila pseudoananassae]|nr:hypothetical protein KR074_010314 [Drosophila pseudoananassae]
MIEVYTRCKDLFRREVPVRMSYWWVDITPAIYKEKLESMTVFDCHRLRRGLARQLEDEEGIGKFLIEILALILAGLLIVVTLVLLCRITLRQIRLKHRIDAPNLEDIPEEPPPEVLPMPMKKRKNFKSWLRGHCRPLFVHSEAEMRNQKDKAHRVKAVHKELTKEKIVLWSKARERDALKKQEKLAKKKSHRQNPISTTS